METFNMLEEWKKLLEIRQWEEHKFLSGFSSSKVVWPLLTILNVQDVHQLAKQMKMWNKRKNLCPKIEETLPTVLLICSEFYWGQFRAFEGLQTRVRLTPNSCLLPYPFPENEVHKGQTLCERVKNVGQERLERVLGLLSKVTAGDETWVLWHDPENRWQ